MALKITLSIMIHGLISMAFVSTDHAVEDRGGSLVINAMFAVTILSFITTIFDIINIIPPESNITVSLYVWYLGIISAGSVSALLLKAERHNRATRYAANVAIGSVWFIVAQSFLIVFREYIDLRAADGMFYRVLLAALIFFGAAVIITAIFHRLYRAHHPESAPTKSGTIKVPNQNGEMITIQTSRKKPISGWAIVFITIGVIFALPYISAILSFIISTIFF